MSSNLNILILGDAGVGKTSFITMKNRDKFIRDYIPTMGVENTNILYKNITFNISEFAGQEKFGFKKYLGNLNPDAIILMFDCASNISYKNIQYWYDAISVKHIPIILIGNKCDSKYIKYDGPKNIYHFEKQNLKYFNVSTQNNININEVFDYLYTILNTN